MLDGFGGWYEDFWELSTERQIGMGVGAIPAHAIDAHVAGWRYDDADMFRSCIRKMDAIYLENANGDGEGPPDNDLTARDAFKSATAAHRRG